MSSLDEDGWSDFEINTLRFKGHPQETTENSVDLAHLRYVHGYDNVNPIQEFAADGPRISRRVSTLGEAVRLPES